MDFPSPDTTTAAFQKATAQGLHDLHDATYNADEPFCAGILAIRVALAEAIDRIAPEPSLDDVRVGYYERAVDDAPLTQDVDYLPTIRIEEAA